MKNLAIIFLLVALLPAVYGQTKAESTFTVTGTRFLLPLFDRFNEDLAANGKQAVFKVTSRNPEASITAAATPKDLPAPKVGFKQVVLAEIVYLPVVNSKHPQIHTLLSKGFTVEELRRVFFNKNQEQDITSEVTPKFNVLTRSACAAVSFSHFVKEDIKYLINDHDKIENDSLLFALIKADTLSISFLDPSNIYDSKTGKQKEGIEVIPIDIDLNGEISDQERFYQTKATLIQKLKNDVILLPSGLLTISYPENIESDIQPYVNWVKTKAGTIIRDYGFLDIDDK